MLFRKIGVLKSRDTVPKIHVSEPTRPPGFSTLLTQLIDGVLHAKFYLANDYFVANYAKLAGKQAIGGTKVISMYSSTCTGFYRNSDFLVVSIGMLLSILYREIQTCL